GGFRRLHVSERRVFDRQDGAGRNEEPITRVASRHDPRSGKAIRLLGGLPEVLDRAKLAAALPYGGAEGEQERVERRDGLTRVLEGPGEIVDFLVGPPRPPGGDALLVVELGERLEPGRRRRPQDSGPCAAA